MGTKPQQREHYLDSVRACLMLLGVPFHVSLLYSTHLWAVNAPHSSVWLTLINDFIHAFRMQVFFVISGYFSCMLYQRYAPSTWLRLRLERAGIPMLAAIPLLTLPQALMLRSWTARFNGWSQMDTYHRFNLLAWELISHLWFLLVLCLLTVTGLALFRWLRSSHNITKYSGLSWCRLTLVFLTCSIMWIAFRRLISVLAPALLQDALFNIAVMQMLSYLPFFILGALAWKYPAIKALFIRPDWRIFLAAALAFAACLANLKWSRGDGWLWDLNNLITTLMGLWMVNVVLSFGYRFLNSHSPGITYLVNASLFIYLVHHPLTLLYGLFITPLISSNMLGFIVGLTLVFAAAFMLYEIHLRIPLLRFLFSGKPGAGQPKEAAICLRQNRHPADKCRATPGSRR